MEKNYKDFDQKWIGESDIATLILVGGSSEGLKVEQLHFGIDNYYDAYMVNENISIPSHYEKVAEFKYWMKIYDDNGLNETIKADNIIVYRAGEMGCVIQNYNNAE